MSNLQLTKVSENLQKLIKKLNTQIEPQLVPVETEPYSEYLQCFNNVTQKIKKDGGMIHYGWHIHYNKFLCEAEHHAVWENEDGKLIDITPNEDAKKEIVFISDNNSFTGKTKPNVRINLTNKIIIDDVIEICDTIDKLQMYSTRIDKDTLVYDKSIYKIFNKYGELKNMFLPFAFSLGGNRDSRCYCGSGKKYLYCHRNIIKSHIKKDLIEAERIHQSLSDAHNYNEAILNQYNKGGEKEQENIQKSLAIRDTQKYL